MGLVGAPLWVVSRGLCGLLGFIYIGVTLPHESMCCSDAQTLGRTWWRVSEWLTTFIEDIALKWQGTLISTIREFAGESWELMGSWKSDLKPSWGRYSLWWGWDSCVCNAWFYTEPAGMRCGQPQRPGKFNCAWAGPLSLFQNHPKCTSAATFWCYQ